MLELVQCTLNKCMLWKQLQYVACQRKQPPVENNFTRTFLCSVHMSIKPSVTCHNTVIGHVSVVPAEQQDTTMHKLQVNN